MANQKLLNCFTDWFGILLLAATIFFTSYMYGCYSIAGPTASRFSDTSRNCNSKSIGPFFSRNSLLDHPCIRDQLHQPPTTYSNQTYWFCRGSHIILLDHRFIRDQLDQPPTTYSSNQTCACVAWYLDLLPPTLVLYKVTIFDYEDCSKDFECSRLLPYYKWCIRNVAMIPLNENTNWTSGCVETYFMSYNSVISLHYPTTKARDRYLVDEYLIRFQDKPPTTYRNQTWPPKLNTATIFEYQDSLECSTTSFPAECCICNVLRFENTNGTSKLISCTSIVVVAHFSCDNPLHPSTKARYHYYFGG